MADRILWFNNNPAESVGVTVLADRGSIRQEIVDRIPDWPEAVLAIGISDPQSYRSGNDSERHWAFRICPKTRTLLRVNGQQFVDTHTGRTD